MTRDELKDLLKVNKAKVVFDKVDGSKREMACTLKSEYLPELKGSSRPVNESVLPVWDLENDGWRSFRVNSVRSVEIIND